MVDLTPLLAFRWSPRAFDPAAELTGEEASSLLEAARWAPSTGNAQPWRFALGHRDDETWKRTLVSLPEPDQRWARHAAALVVGAHAGTDPERAAYDLGQAMAHLTVQATALGLYVHQLTRFDRAALCADLDLPPPYARWWWWRWADSATPRPARGAAPAGDRAAPPTPGARPAAALSHPAPPAGRSAGEPPSGGHSPRLARSSTVAASVPR